jgi:hypothetical protein
MTDRQDYIAPKVLLPFERSAQERQRKRWFNLVLSPISHVEKWSEPFAQTQKKNVVYAMAHTAK